MKILTHIFLTPKKPPNALKHHLSTKRKKYENWKSKILPLSHYAHDAIWILSIDNRDHHLGRHYRLY